MELTLDFCYRALLAMDPRFDGRFYLGVRTTGVFCRPVCPAPKPRRHNVQVFPTAAAAVAEGFRPCLRCRPELAPGSVDASTRVARALRRIAEGVLEEGGVGDLAREFGMSARQMRRLFSEHVGASPKEVAKTQRLQIAKQLIDEGDLPMTRVAFAAGFSSVRRFNDAIKSTYDRSPTQLRSLRAKNGRLAQGAGGSTVLRLGYRKPFDWQSLLGFLAPRATPGVEQVEGGVYRRTISHPGGDGVLEVSCPAQESHLVLALKAPPTRQILTVVQRVRQMFDLDAEPGGIDGVLREDPALGPLLSRRPGLRVPGAWNPFELAVRAVLGQQVTVKGATTLAGRIACFGKPVSEERVTGLTHLFPTPGELASADLESVGLTRTRRRTLRELARATLVGRLRFGVADPEEIRAALIEIPGVGDWTAEYIAMRTGDPDAFPSGDLGLRKALKQGSTLSPTKLKRRAEDWRPWRSYAAMHLWTGLSAGAVERSKR